MKKILEKSGNFVRGKKWEPCSSDWFQVPSLGGEGRTSVPGRGYPGMGYPPARSGQGTPPGQDRVPPLQPGQDGVPPASRIGLPPPPPGKVMPQAVCLLRFTAGGLSCLKKKEYLERKDRHNIRYVCWT